MEVLYARCCGIDVHKESLVACLRQQDGRRKQADVQSFGTTTAEILRLHAWLSAAACTHVAMESTGVYWQPVFNLLEGWISWPRSWRAWVRSTAGLANVEAPNGPPSRSRTASW